MNNNFNNRKYKILKLQYFFLLISSFNLKDKVIKQNDKLSSLFNFIFLLIT